MALLVKYLLFGLVLLLLMPSVFSGTTNVVFQSNATNAKDTYIDKSAATSNYGSLYYGMLQVYSSTYIRRLLFYFDTTSIPSTATITSAKLQVYVWQVNGAGNLAVSIYPLTRTWTEGGVTWNTYDGANGWTTAGGDFNTSRTLTSAYNMGALGVHNITLNASLINTLFQENNTNGWILKGDSEAMNPINVRTINMSEDTGFPANRPYLFITYTTPDASNNSCTYTSEDWNINIADNCNITSAVVMNASSKLTINGSTSSTDRLYITGSIKGFSSAVWQGLNTLIWGVLG